MGTETVVVEGHMYDHSTDMFGDNRKIMVVPYSLIQLGNAPNEPVSIDCLLRGILRGLPEDRPGNKFRITVEVID